MLYRRFGKRCLDISLAVCGIIILAPVYAAIWLAVRIFLGSPAFFVQTRPGLNGRPFRIIKFRTMRDLCDSSGRPLPDEDRVCPFGQWLRSTSLDELPELWNVACGDMSLVGPRPLLMEYLPHYTHQQLRRHQVRPGVTGLAQVEGRNRLSWPSRLALDVEYVDKCSFWLDIKILAKTLWKVALRDGISVAGRVTAEPLVPLSPLIVIGAGGHSAVVRAVLNDMGESIDSVYDDDAVRWGSSVGGALVDGPVEKLRDRGRLRAIVAVGDNQARKRLTGLVSMCWARAIHPTACIHGSVAIGQGSVVFAGAVLQPNCSVGSHVIVNTGALVDHDCKIGDFASIGPGAVLSGGVIVGEGAMIGAGATVLPGRAIGRFAKIGAGATVTRDIPDEATALGSPARAVSETHPAKSPFEAWPVFDDEQIEVVQNVLRSGKVNAWTGTECTSFENEYANELGVKHAIALSNGTVALELALQALGIGPGDEVIVPSRTFIATASAVVMRGAVPVVADIDSNSQTLTAETIKAALTAKTRAVIAVHLGGWPCDMDAIMAIADSHGLYVIEDCAQSHGARYKGKAVGSIGHINAFSFCQDKIISTGGEGGLVTTNDTTLWERAWQFKDHGKSIQTLARSHQVGSFRFVHDSFGTNFRLTEMQAAIGRVQLRRLAQWVDQRRSNAECIMQGLGEFLGFPRPASDVYHSYYRLYGFVEPSRYKQGWSRDRLIMELQKRNIPVGCGSCGVIYRERAFASLSRNKTLPVASRLHETSLAFAVHPTLERRQLEQIIHICRGVFSAAICIRGQRRKVA